MKRIYLILVALVGSLLATAHSVGGHMTSSNLTNATTRYWSVSPFDYQYDMTMYAILPGIDYDKCEIAAFVGDECRGTLEYNESGYGYIRIYSNVSSDENITFRMHDNVSGKTYIIYNKNTFAANSVIGLPSSPVQFSLYGDINGDNKVNKDDVAVLANIILGKTTNNTGIADLNSDTKVTTADVTTLIDYLLGF